MLHAASSASSSSAIAFTIAIAVAIAAATTRHSVFELFVSSSSSDPVELIIASGSLSRCISKRQQRHEHQQRAATSSTSEPASRHSRHEHVGSDDRNSSDPTASEQRLEHDGGRDVAVGPLGVIDSELCSSRRYRAVLGFSGRKPFSRSCASLQVRPCGRGAHALLARPQYSESLSSLPACACVCASIVDRLSIAPLRSIPCVILGMARWSCASQWSLLAHWLVVAVMFALFCPPPVCAVATPNEAQPDLEPSPPSYHGYEGSDLVKPMTRVPVPPRSSMC